MCELYKTDALGDTESDGGDDPQTLKVDGTSAGEPNGSLAYTLYGIRPAVLSLLGPTISGIYKK